jgi:hypothetical protein
MPRCLRLVLEAADQFELVRIIGLFSVGVAFTDHRWPLSYHQFLNGANFKNVLSAFGKFQTILDVECVFVDTRLVLAAATSLRPYLGQMSILISIQRM